MLRNSTKQFKAKYELNSKQHYKSIDQTPSKPSKEFYRASAKRDSTTNITLTPKTIKIPKTQQSSTFHTRAFKVRTKESLENEEKMNLNSTKFSHRRQLTSPLNKKQIEDDSIGSMESLRWNHKDDLSVLSRDGEDFIDALPHNSIFYCCSCFHYVFSIEKTRHYPQCRDTIDLSQKERPQFRKMAWNRLQKIAQLSRYTHNKSWQIEQLYRQIKTHQFNKIFTVSCPLRPNFFTFQQIVTAFVYTYQCLLKGALVEKSSIFSCF